MRKLSVMMSMFFLVMFFVSSASAYTITYDFDLDGNNFTSPVAGATIEDFEAALLWTWTGDYAVVTGSVNGQYAAPFGDSSADDTKYVTVPKTTSNGSATVTDLGGTYNYFGLWWGSVDEYNTLEFYLDGSLVAGLDGTVVAPPADGNQSASATNLYVNFFDLPDFNSFKMISTEYAFEADNIAVARVPEPGTLLLFGSGLTGLVLYRRRSMKK